MKVIKCLVEQIREELCDGKEYAKLAMEYRESDRRLADVYVTLAAQELNHVNSLHAQAQRIISESKTDPPAAMQAVWDWEHDRMIGEMASITVLIDMYKK